MTTQASGTARHGRALKLNYSGRIIDHLGIQMYQSPVAAIAELVANALGRRCRPGIHRPTRCRHGKRRNRRP